MAKQNSNTSKKIAGHIIKGSAVGDLFVALQDQKVHKLSALAPIAKRHKATLTGRLANLRRVGARKRMFQLSVDREKGTVRLQLRSKSKVARKPGPRKAVPAAQSVASAA